jgi:hypothetical protein
VWDTLTGPATIDNTASKASALRVHSGSRLKISPGKDLTCTGATEINEVRGLVVAADGTSGMAQFLDNGTITGTGTVRTECYFSQSKWHYIAIPVTSTNVAPYKDLYMKYYIEPTHAWKNVVSPGLDTTLATAMQGYSVWSGSVTGNATVKLTGTLNTAPKSATVTRTAYSSGPYTHDGWNQVGNPYVSAVNLADAGITWNNVEQKAYFWDPVAGSYKWYLVAGGGNHSQYAPPQQGFFVHHSTANTVNGTLTLPQSSRVINSESFLKSNEELADYLLLRTERPGYTKYDEVAVYFRPEASEGYDDYYDAKKLSGAFDTPQGYLVIPDEQLALNALPWTDENQVIPMGFKCGVSGDFMIGAHYLESFREGTTVILEDLKEEKLQELNSNPEYYFSYVTGEDPNRFLLHFFNPFVGTGEKDGEAFRIYSWEDGVYVKHITNEHLSGKILLYNMTGKKVFEGVLADLPLNIFHPELTDGYYVALVQTETTIVTGKLFLKQN